MSSELSFSSLPSLPSLLPGEQLKNTEFSARICFPFYPQNIARCEPSGETRTWKTYSDYKLGEINGIVHVEDKTATLTYLQGSDLGSVHSMSWVAKGNDGVIISLNGLTAEAKVSEDKMTISGIPSSPADTLTWITPEEAKKIREENAQRGS